MTDNYLMEKGGAKMFVPPSKLQEFKDEGWTVIQEPDPKPRVKQVDALPPVPEVQDEALLTVDEAVERSAKRKGAARSKSSGSEK
jgi:hypothetical protein